MTGNRNRDHDILTITDHIDTLTVKMLVNEHYNWSPRREGLRHRTTNGAWVEHTGPIPKREQRRHIHNDPPIVTQLETQETLASAGSHEPITGGGPRSRPPINITQWDLLETVTSEAVQWRTRLAALAARPKPRPAPVAANLAAIRGLCLRPTIPDATIHAVARWLTKIVNEALVELDYHAPIVTLGYVCGECGGVLRTRSDATANVWCAGQPMEGPAPAGQLWPLWAPSCGTKYPPALWPELLTGIA